MGKNVYQSTAVLLMSIFLIFVANRWGFWYVTVIIGFIIGLLLKKSLAIAVSLTSGVISWTLNLLYHAQDGKLLKAANVVAQIIGLNGHSGVIVLCANSAVGGIYAVIGTWLGVSIYSFKSVVGHEGYSRSEPRAN